MTVTSQTDTQAPETMIGQLNEPMEAHVNGQVTVAARSRGSSSAVADDHAPALEVQGVTKVFVKSPGLLARIRRRARSNGASASQTNGTGKTGGAGATNGALGNGDAKRVVAVDNVSITVERGEIFGLLGPNGTGKSTLIRLISTLLLPDDGRICVFGYDVVREDAQVKRLINRVSVEASFFKKLTPMENLMYAARLYGVDARHAREESMRIMKRLGLEERSASEPMEDMSRGMQQKVAIARAFLTSPSMLLLDEPTTGLDPHSKRAVQAFVRDIRREHDTTVLLTTHDMYEADVMCDRIAIIDKGRIVALDTPTGLKGQVRTDDGREPSLEDVFLELTGRELKNDEEAES